MTFRLIAAVAAALAIAAPAHARVVHRADVPAGEATPTGASFSVRMPVAYNDVEVQAEDPSKSPVSLRMVTGRTPDRIIFSASELTFAPGPPPKPLDDFVNDLKQNSAVAGIFDVQRKQAGGSAALAFTLIDIAGGGSFFDVIRTDKAQYTLTVQFRHEQRYQAAAMKDDFFNSFKLTGH